MNRPGLRTPLAAAIVVACLVLAGPAGAGKPVRPSGLRVNRWVPVEDAGPPGYVYSRPVWVPARKQVLQWGVVERGESRPYFRNDVRAFHADRLAWTSDYPPAEDLPSTVGPPHGKGIWYSGHGEMLECGTPAPSAVVDGVCWDPKRRQVIYTMKGLMAAYDPAKRTWRDMGAETELDGDRLPGGPPVYGVGTGYDPIHDEIVLFPHWGGKNTDLRDETGRLSAHYGTFRYAFGENVWRRVGETFGTEEKRTFREGVIDGMAALSDALDALWRLRRELDKAARDVIRRGLKDLPQGAAILPLLEDGDWERSIERAAGLLRNLERKLETDLRLEPPPRCGTPLIYHPEQECLVMFGGHSGLVRTDLARPGGHGGRPGALNDTWLYDCRSRRWRELDLPRRPPPTLWPKMVYDPASGLILLVTRTGRWEKDEDQAITLWALDLEKEEWTRRHTQPWPWPHGDGHATGWAPDPFEVALDRERGLLLLTQNVRRDKRPVGQTYAMRLEVAKMGEAEPAPAWEPPPRIQPIEIPPEDPAWLARLKSLPANRWIHAKPQREASNRGWGMCVADPVRGWIVYFGGGHSTYQVNNVGVYVVGANTWVSGVGCHNDWVPPVSWGGTAMGMRGGAHAHHQRNEYVSLDGRMFVSMGTESRRWGAESGKRPGPRYNWFYDVDRGGVWRQKRIERIDRGEDAGGLWARCHLAHPDGRILGFGGALEPYDGRFFAGEVYFAEHDPYANTLAVRRVPEPHPGIVYECRPFCVVPKRDAVFFYECAEKDKRIVRQGTWLYHIAENRFEKLPAARMPDGEPGTVCYLPGQDAVFAAVDRNRQWIYSFKQKTWARLPLEADDPKYAFDPVYTQLAYVPQYGVLVSVGSASRGTAVMRPDVSAVNWSE
jgi:hypothetical protein